MEFTRFYWTVGLLDQLELLLVGLIEVGLAIEARGPQNPTYTLHPCWLRSLEPEDHLDCHCEEEPTTHFHPQ